MDAETYQARLIDNACTGAAGCRRPPVDGTSMCKRHLKMQRRRRRRSMERKRDQWEAEGKCRGCGTPRKDGVRCAVCAARRPERVAVEAVDAVVDSDPFRRDSDGWRRYRGKGRRGAPGAAVNDEQDLQDAAKAIDRGRQALAYARSEEVQNLPRIQKRAVLNEALAHLGLAGRTLGEVTARNQGRTVKADDTAGATWDYGKPSDASEISTQARVGEYVYAPPQDPTGRKKDPAARRTPPDLGPLRAALAARGLALAPEGAFYWIVVEAREQQGVRTANGQGVAP